MQKKNDEKLNKDELAVISQLKKYSNSNIELIAKHCGFSRQKVWRIIKKLEEEKIIWGHTTIVDDQQQGLQPFLLLLKRTMKAIDEKTIEKVVFSRLDKEFSDLGITIESSYYVHGEYDWVLIFTTNDLKHAKKFSSMLSGTYQGVIDKIVLMQILYTQRKHHIVNPQSEKILDFI